METAYEAIYIVDTALPEEQVNGIVEKYSGIITSGGGAIDDIDRWEPRRLAYPIKNRRDGLYVVMNFRSEPAAKDEMERIFRISDDVLRHLVIKQDKRADHFPSQARSAEQARRDQEAAERASRQEAAAAAAAAATSEETVTDLGDVGRSDAASGGADSGGADSGDADSGDADNRANTDDTSDTTAMMDTASVPEETLAETEPETGSETGSETEPTTSASETPVEEPENAAS